MGKMNMLLSAMADPAEIPSPGNPRAPPRAAARRRSPPLFHQRAAAGEARAAARETGMLGPRLTVGAGVVYLHHVILHHLACCVHSEEVKNVDMLDGVTILRFEKVKDEIVLDGNVIELDSHSTDMVLE